MRSLSFITLSLGAVLSFVDASSLPEIIYRDVAVIGGGASGAYAAVRMRDDFNKSIALIEKQNILVCVINKCSGFHRGKLQRFGLREKALTQSQ